MEESGSSMKFVAFGEYCPKCKYADRSSIQDPCNDCLGVGAREGTEKPVDFKEKEN